MQLKYPPAEVLERYASAQALAANIIDRLGGPHPESVTSPLFELLSDLLLALPPHGNYLADLRASEAQVLTCEFNAARWQLQMLAKRLHRDTIDWASLSPLLRNRVAVTRGRSNASFSKYIK